MATIHVPLSDWDVGPRYRVLNVLGAGSYGQVATGEEILTRKRVAIKRIPHIYGHITDTRRLLREIHVLRHLYHPNVVRLLDIVYYPAESVLEAVAKDMAAESGKDVDDAFMQDSLQKHFRTATTGILAARKGEMRAKADVIYLVFQQCDTDLHKLVCSAQYLSELHIQTFLYQLLCAIRYLHAANIIHRDVKPANILVNEDCTLLLCDFGLARVLPEAVADAAGEEERTATAQSPLQGVDQPTPSPTEGGAAATAGVGAVGTPKSTEGVVASDLSTSESPQTSSATAGRKRGRELGKAKADTADRASLGGVAAGLEVDDAVSVADTTQGKSPSTGTSSSEEPAAKRARFTMPDGSVMDAASLDSKSSAPTQTSNAKSAAATGIHRQMTRHVVTRFYRAPELILLQDYSLAVDMWSVGCVLAELLSMQPESVPNPGERRPLFPGRSCFPLSAENPTANEDRMDQLHLIMKVLGSPTEEDMVDCDPVVKEYLMKLPPRKAVVLHDRFKGASPAAIDLLTKLLAFAPSRRITIQQAIEHPFLKAVRDLDPSHKRESLPAPCSIDPALMELDMEVPELKRSILAEVLAFKLSLIPKKETGGTSPVT